MVFCPTSSTADALDDGDPLHQRPRSRISCATCAHLRQRHRLVSLVFEPLRLVLIVVARCLPAHHAAEDADRPGRRAS